MALSAQKKKQKKMIIALVALLLIIFFVIYFGYLRSPSVVPSSYEESEFTEINLPELNLDIINDSRFQNLKPYGNLPIDIGETGNESPF